MKPLASLNAMLGFCSRAGKLAVGAEASKKAVSGRKAFLVMVSPTASENTRDEIIALCARNGMRLLTEHDFSADIGRPACKIAAVIDRGFAETIVNAYDSKYAVNN